jgi:hypothetical protein
MDIQMRWNEWMKEKYEIEYVPCTQNFDCQISKELTSSRSKRRWEDHRETNCEVVNYIKLIRKISFVNAVMNFCVKNTNFLDKLLNC